MSVKTIDVPIERATWLRCDQFPTPSKGCIVYAIRVDGQTWEPGNSPEQEAAADIALSMGFECVYLHREDDTEQVIMLQKVDS